jgi:methionine synthase I (cobalamin-dependent)
MISGTISIFPGAIFPGQTPEAFWYSITLRPFRLGLNYSFGAEQLRPSVADMAAATTPDQRLSNAGLLARWANRQSPNI